MLSNISKFTSEYFLFSFLASSIRKSPYLELHKSKSSILNLSLMSILIKAFNFLGTHFSNTNLFAIARRYFGVVLKYVFEMNSDGDLQLLQKT